MRTANHERAFAALLRLFSVLLVLVLAGCSGGDVDIVKKGTMHGYATTTVGAAFDASFDDPTWKAFEGEKGKRIVEFSGKISKTLHEDFVKRFLRELGDTPSELLCDYAKNLVSEAEYQRLYESLAGEGNRPQGEVCKDVFLAACDARLWTVGTPVTFQWLISPNGKDFNLAYVQQEGWGGDFKPDVILSVIFE